MRYDLTDLRLFVAIAEAQNLTRGAERAQELRRAQLYLL